MKIKVLHCARCGEDHEMEFSKFSDNPIECDETIYTHWGLCPNTSEPVILTIIECENDNQMATGKS
jgi:hypothetical protein